MKYEKDKLIMALKYALTQAEQTQYDLCLQALDDATETAKKLEEHYRNTQQAIADEPKSLDQQIAPGHNPASVTVSQVGEGYRLLDPDEIKDRNETIHIEAWTTKFCRWSDLCFSGCSSPATYRTKLSREELAKLP